MAVNRIIPKFIREDEHQTLIQLDAVISAFDVGTVSTVSSQSTRWNGFTHSNGYLSIASQQSDDHLFEQPDRPHSPTLSPLCSVASSASRRLTSFFVDTSPTTTQLVNQAISTDWSESSLSPLITEREWIDKQLIVSAHVIRQKDCAIEGFPEEANFPLPPPVQTFTADIFVMPPPPDLSPPPEFAATPTSQSEPQLVSANENFRKVRIPQQLLRQHQQLKGLNTNQLSGDSTLPSVGAGSVSARYISPEARSRPPVHSPVPETSGSVAATVGCARRPSVPRRSPSTRLSSAGLQSSTLRVQGTTTASRLDDRLAGQSSGEPKLNGSAEVNTLPVGDIIKKFDNIWISTDPVNGVVPRRSQTLDRGCQRQTGDVVGFTSSSPVARLPISLPAKPNLKSLQPMLASIATRSNTPNWLTKLPQVSLGSSVTDSEMTKTPHHQHSPCAQDQGQRVPITSFANDASPPTRPLQLISNCLNGGHSQEEGLNRISVRRESATSNCDHVNLPSLRRRTSSSLSRANSHTPISVPLESLHLDATTLETLVLFEVADASQIPGYQPLLVDVPSWKQQRVERRNREAAEAYAMDLRKWGRTPQWKRDLIEKRHQSIKQDTGAATSSSGCPTSSATDVQRVTSASSIISEELTRKLQRQLERVSSSSAMTPECPPHSGLPPLST